MLRPGTDEDVLTRNRYAVARGPCSPGFTVACHACRAMIALQFCQGMRVHTSAEIGQSIAKGRIEMLERCDEAEVPANIFVIEGGAFFRYGKRGEGRSFKRRQYVHIRSAKGHKGTASHGTGYQAFACGFGIAANHCAGRDIQSNGKSALGGQGVAGLEQSFGHAFCQSFCYALVAAAGTGLFVQAFYGSERHIAPLK